MARRILVVEDSPTQAERLRLLLEEGGYQVELAGNGREGLVKIRAAPPDLIISDILMPEMDGYEFCQAVKSSEKTRHIPLILLTQQSAPSDILRGLTLGADNFIPKPFEDEPLLERLTRIFEHLEYRRKGRLEVEVKLRVGDRELVITPDKQQIVELLFATFNDVGRLNEELRTAGRQLEDYASGLETKVEERTRAIRRLNRSLRTISQCHQFLTRSTDERELIGEICRVIVESGGPLAAWVGFAEEDGKRLLPAVAVGWEPDRLSRHAIDLADPAWEHCPAARALRLGTPQTVHGPLDASLRCPPPCEAARPNPGSCISLPLTENGRCFGVLTIYSAHGETFDEEEIALFAELAADLAHGINTLRMRAAHERALAAIESMARFPGEDPSPVLRVGVDGRVLYANPASVPLLRSWGIRAGEPLRQEWGERVHRALETGRSERVDLVCEDRVYDMLLVPLRGEAYVNLYGRDITERRRAEEELRESETLFRTLFERHTAVKFILDPNTGNILDANDAAERYYGWSRTQLRRMRIQEINTLPPDALALQLERAKTRLQARFEFRHRRADGSIRDVEVFSSQLMVKGKGLLHSIIHDITERKEAEAALQGERDFSDAIVNSLPGVFYLVDEQRKLLRWNLDFERVTGCTGSELAAIDPLTFFGEAERAAVAERMQMVFDQGRAEVEAELVARDGRHIPYYFTGVRIEIDRTRYLLGVGIDITARKRLEAQLRQQQKLEALGTLASGVAHEINNPITGIMNYAQLIADAGPPDSQTAGYAAEIVRETERVATIVRNLLQFARQEPHTASLARLTDIVEHTLSLLRAVLRRDQIALTVDIPDDLPPIHCRSQQLQQVLMNLLTNARDALNARYPAYDPDKTITITARRLAERDGVLRLTVADRGVGIPPELQERIFDPFFTTKPRDHGTGLGLSISHGIVREHRGQLTFETLPGGGTQFHLDLPTAA